MNKTVIGLVIFVILSAGIAFVALSGNSDDTTSDTSNQPQPSNEQNDSTNSTDTSSNDDNASNNGAADTFTAEQVAAHASEDDCWTIINGSVYDITAYIPDHPGGDEILRACGADGTTLFTQRTTTSGETVGSGTPHSSTAASQLEFFKIGELAEQ